MNLLLRTLLPAAAVSLVAAPAGAADFDAPIYDPPIYVERMPEYVPVEVGSGWYLRGDVTYTMKTRAGRFDYRTFDPVAGTYGDASFDTGRLRERFGAGLGFGYHFSDMLRGDLTLDASTVRFSGTTSAGVPCIDPAIDAAFAGTTCRSEDSASAAAWSAMANAYVDLGTVVGITPYVGAGVGYTYLRWNSLSNSLYCVDGGGACPQAFVGTDQHPGLRSWRFTWAAMAGVAYDVSNNVKVDLGYRYRRIAGGNMFGFDAATAAAGASGVQGRDNGFSQHQVRVGLRYSLW